MSAEFWFDDSDLDELLYEPPPGYELAGFWCWRGGGHVCGSSCKSDSVPLFAQAKWAPHVLGNIKIRSDS